MHINQIKEVVKVLTSSGETNKEAQSCTLGYVVGLEAPIGLDQKDPDDKLEWNSFFNDIPGQINEHFLLNLALAQDVANLTLQYRQAVMNGSDEIGDLASRFVKVTGAAFGLFGDQGTINLLRKVLKGTVQERRAGIEERMNARKDAENRRRAEARGERVDRNTNNQVDENYP